VNPAADVTILRHVKSEPVDAGSTPHVAMRLATGLLASSEARRGFEE